LASTYLPKRDRKLFVVLFLLSIVMLLGCSNFHDQPITYAGKTLVSDGFTELPNNLSLKIYRKDSFSPAHHLRIYIEGDGANWLFQTFPPSSPTPNRAFSASLASKDHSAQTSYISRPCQFINLRASTPCPSDLWQKGRFSEEAIRIVSDAIDLLKSTLGLDLSAPTELIGYSGGGVMATLLAAKRSDVDCLVTIAAPLDLNSWTRLHQVAPLNHSIQLPQLSPIEKSRLQIISQFHFYGTLDTIVPFKSIINVQSMLGKKAKWLQIEGFDHQNNWILAWPELLKTTCLGG